MFYFFESTNTLQFYHCCNTRICKGPYYTLSLDQFFKLKEENKLTEKLIEIENIEDFHCQFSNTEHCIYKKWGPAIQVSISKACNLNCPFCYVKSGHYDSSIRKQVYFDFLNAIKNAFPNYILQLTDFGEPFFS